MRAAITGGAGFIGHHLVRALVQGGHEVAVLDDFSTGSRRRLASFANRIAIREGSVLDAEALDATFRDCKVVLHAAAIASVVQSFEDPRRINEVNVNGTIEVVMAAARCRVQRVVLAGSSAVYGASEQLPCRESQRPEPTSPYGASKLAAEHYLHALGKANGVATSALRYFNVFGPGQDPAAEYAAVVPRFITAVLEGRRPIINGNDQISRDFVYVDDVVQANLLAARATAPAHHTCNIASGSRTSLGALLEAVARAAGRDVEPIFGPPRTGDIEHSQADISQAAEQLGFRPMVPLEAGIARTLAWFRDSSRDGEGATPNAARTT